MRSQLYAELQMLEDFRLWAQLGFLVCPRELMRPNALEIMRIALKDSFVVPIFRNQVRRVR